MSNHFDDSTVAAARAAGPIDDLPDFGPSLTTVDRSTLERYEDCAAQGRFIELGRVMTSSSAKELGNAVHRAFSETTAEYVAAWSAGDYEIDASVLADIFRGALLRPGPGFHREAYDAAGHCAWAWASFLAGTRNRGGGIAVRSIIGFDGGGPGRSGQLAWDIPHLGLRATAELDFLYAGPSPNVLHAIDWKSGRTQFTVSTIADSFQFQMHAWLVLSNFPAIEQLEVRVWRTRFGGLTAPVVFSREELPRFESRIIHAAMAWQRSQGVEPESCEATPTTDACRLCPAAKLCPITAPESCAADPAAFLVAYYALSAQLDAMHDELTAHAKANGDVQFNGLAFGFDKPTARKQSSLYFIGASSDAADNE